MGTPLEQENLRPVFNKILKTHQLKPEDVHEKQAKIDISDRGQFDCETCCHTWISSFSWITFDLIELRVSYRWKMKCMHCLMPYIPTFTVEQIEAMFDRAVCRYKGEDTRTVNIGYKARRERSQPHLPQLCEKCLWGASMCWQRRNW